MPRSGRSLDLEADPPLRFTIDGRAIGLVSLSIAPALAMWTAAMTDGLDAAPAILLVGAVVGLIVANRLLGAAANRDRATDRDWPMLGPAANDLAMVVDPDGLSIRLMGPAVEELLGYRKRELLDKPLTRLVSGPQRAEVEELLRSSTEESRSRTDVKLRCADGVDRWFELSVRRRGRGPQRGLLINLVDVDERKGNEIRIGEAVARQQVVLDHSTEIFILTDHRLMVDHISPNVERITGHRVDSLRDGPVAAVLDERSVETLVELLHRPEVELEDTTIAAEVPSPAHGALPAELVVRELSPNIHDGYLLVLRPLPNAERAGEVLDRRTSLDELTGLFDRASFELELAAALRRLPTGHQLAVVNFDIVGFADVSDAVGFDRSDRLMVEVAGRLRSALRGVDVLGRLSTDEFAVAAIGPSVRTLRRFADRLAWLFEEPFEVDGQSYRLPVAVGMAATEDRRADPNHLLRASAVALHQAINQGTDEVVVYDQALQDQAVERFELTNAMEPALQAGQFSLAYQPLISLRTGRVESLEALLRWQHPTLGAISPGTFIPLAEKSGMIVELGRWVMEQACAQLVDWRTRLTGYDDIAIGINLSARQLEHHGELDALLFIIERSGLDLQSLIVELTESVVVDDRGWISSQLHHLRELGTRIAIDDFGTGAAGLNHLRELPYDVVKIDKSYIDKVGTEPAGETLVGQIIELAQGMGATTVAEGIETEEQLAALALMGCDIGQGYHLAKPMPADRIEDWMSEREAERAQARAGRGASVVSSNVRGGFGEAVAFLARTQEEASLVSVRRRRGRRQGRRWPPKHRKRCLMRH